MAKKPKKEEETQVDRLVLDLVKSMETEEKGAPYDTILERAEEHMTREAFEAVMEDLLDGGHLVEPELGALRLGDVEYAGPASDIEVKELSDEEVEQAAAASAPSPASEFATEPGAKGQVTLDGKRPSIGVARTIDIITRHKLWSTDAGMSVTDIEFDKKCLPTTTKKGKEKPAKLTVRALVVQKLRLKSKHPIHGGEWEARVDAFEREVKEIFQVR